MALLKIYIFCDTYCEKSSKKNQQWSHSARFDKKNIHQRLKKDEDEVNSEEKILPQKGEKRKSIPEEQEEI